MVRLVYIYKLLIVIVLVVQNNSIISNCQSKIDNWKVRYFADTTAITSVDAKIEYISGGLRDVSNPSTETLYNFNANGGGYIGAKFNVGGSFTYNYFNRHQQCYSMLTFPSMFPFFCSDTVASKQTAEHYIADGFLIYDVIKNRMSLGADVGFFASTTAKLRDVRNKNVYSDFYIAPNVSMTFGSLTFGAEYRYWSMAEDVTFKTYGTNQTIFVEKVEGLWFGEQLAFSVADFDSRRHSGDENRLSLSSQYLNNDLSLRGEISYYSSHYDIDIRDNEKKVGNVDKNGWNGKLSISKKRNNLVQIFDIEGSIDNQTSYVPIQQKEFSGTATHFVQYGWIKRYLENIASLLALYKFETERFSVGANVETLSEKRSVLIYPQTFQQVVNRQTAIANAEYKIAIRNSSLFQNVKLMLNLGYSIASGDCLKRKFSSVSDENYYYNDKLLQEQYNWRTANYMICNPTIVVDFKIANSLLSVALSYKTHRSTESNVGTSRDVLSLQTTLQMFK